MAGGNIDIRLKAGGGTQVSAEVGKASAAVKDFSSVFKRLGAEIARGGIWAVSGSAFTRAVASFKETIAGAFRSAFGFEKMTAQFKTLVGNIDEARAHMADLKELGDTPPFSLGQFAAASRELMVMTDGVLGYKQSLELVGDAAAATGRPIEAMGHAVGRLYAFIRDGQPLSRAVMELRNMGVLAPEVAQKLQDMQTSGAGAAEIWAEVENALKRYAGAMKETEATGDGLVGAIKTRWENFVRKFGEAFSDAAKGGMETMLAKMKELEESGAIEEWADDAVDELGRVAESVKSIASALGSIAGGVWKGVKGTLGTAMAFAAGMDESGRRGEGWFNFSKGAAAAGEYWRREVKGEIPEDEARQEAALRKSRAREREERRKEREEEERARQAAAFAESDLKRLAREKAEIEKKEAEDAKAWEKERTRLVAAADSEWRQLMREEARERDRIDRELHRKRMDDIRKEIDAQKEAASALENTASAAQSEFDKAFAMYRDPERAAAEIGEEKDYREDLSRLHRDAARYGGKWRIDELSRLMASGDAQGASDALAEWRKSRSFTPEVEAMVRASAAENAKTAAEDALRKIEMNTAGLSQKLDELLSLKGGS